MIIGAQSCMLIHSTYWCCALIRRPLHCYGVHTRGVHVLNIDLISSFSCQGMLPSTTQGMLPSTTFSLHSYTPLTSLRCPLPRAPTPYLVITLRTTLPYHISKCCTLFNAPLSPPPPPPPPQSSSMWHQQYLLTFRH